MTWTMASLTLQSWWPTSLITLSSSLLARLLVAAVLLLSVERGEQSRHLRLSSSSPPAEDPSQGTVLLARLQR